MTRMTIQYFLGESESDIQSAYLYGELLNAQTELKLAHHFRTSAVLKIFRVTIEEIAQ